MKYYSVLVIAILSYSTALSVLCYMGGITNVQFLLSMKDASLAIGIAIVVAWRILQFPLRENRLCYIDWAVLGVTAVNLISLAFSSATLDLKLLNLRRNVTLFWVLWVFYFVGRSQSVRRAISSASYTALAIIIAFGLFEYFLPNSFWDYIVNLPGYWKSITLDPFAADSIAESGRFYSFDLLSLTGHATRRMVSLYIEPTTLAAFFSAMFCWSYIGAGRLVRAAILIAGLLTQSKFFLISVVAIVLIRRFSRSLSPRLMGYCYAACVLLATVTILSGIHAGALAHLNGIVSLYGLVVEKRFLGYGIGAAGNYAAADSDISVGDESGIGNICAQLGIGILIYLWIINALYSKLLARWKSSRRTEYLVGIMMLVSWVISFFLSASSLGVSGNAFFFIFIGCILASTPDALTADTRMDMHFWDIVRFSSRKRTKGKVLLVEAPPEQNGMLQ